MYPVADYIYFGIHVKEQIDALSLHKQVDADVYFINGRGNKLNYLKSIYEIRKQIVKGNYDVIHIHYGISGIFLLFFKPLIPVIITLHSGELFQKKGKLNHLMQKSLTMRIVRKVNKVIVLNDDMILLLKKYKNKLIKLPCGSDLKIFNAINIIKDTPTILIGFPGNKARKEKNYQLFLDIINTLKILYPIKIVEFHNLTRSEVVENLNRMDVLLMTSTVEGSPQIIKEAMACNKPIVSTSVGDVVDLLADVKNSFVIKSFKPENFIEPIKQLLALAPTERISTGRAKLLKMGLDAESVSEKIIKIYEEVI